MKKIIIGALCAQLLISGCATVFSGTTKLISIKVTDQDTNQEINGATCNVVDGKGLTYQIFSNPGQFVATKGNGALTPNCKKDGYTQTSYGVGDSFNKTSLVNVLFWPGFLVDSATGAIKDYPSHINVYMKKNSKTQ